MAPTRSAKREVTPRSVLAMNLHKRLAFFRFESFLQFARVYRDVIRTPSSELQLRYCNYDSESKREWTRGRVNFV